VKAIDVKLFGPWKKVTQLLESLPQHIKASSTSAQRSVAQKYVTRVKSHIKNQDIPGWTPLSNRYADYKMAKYGTEDILIATWDYYDSIKIWRQGGIYHAGIPKGISYPGNHGIEISRVAAIHEAWVNVPGRPHRPLWAYTLKMDMGGPRGIRLLVNNTLRDKLRKQGYPVRQRYMI